MLGSFDLSPARLYGKRFATACRSLAGIAIAEPPRSGFNPCSDVVESSTEKGLRMGGPLLGFGWSWEF